METISYQVEPLSQCQIELSSHLHAHWHEVALNHDEVPLNPDWDQYHLLQNLGQLQIVVFRISGKLEGYHVSILRSHLHYKSTLHGFTDVFYINPKFRKGGYGIKLFKFAEAEWKRRGVVKGFTATKIHKYLDISTLLEWLGWIHIEKQYSKLI